MARGSSLQDLVYVGLVGICDPPRPFVRESIQTLLQSGVKVKLVTGDAQETATAIGKAVVLFCSESFAVLVAQLASNFLGIVAAALQFRSCSKSSVLDDR
jgi:P-type E1-E2 ATPase